MPRPTAERSAPTAHALEAMSSGLGTIDAAAASSGDVVVLAAAPWGGCAEAMNPVRAPLLACRAIDRA
jgi:hypothetical protein